MTDVNEMDSKAYESLLKEVKELRKENAALRGDCLVVGVRWFGLGGFGTGLKKEVNGKKTFAVDGYGSYGVMDINTWNYLLKNDSHVAEGLLVRDDSVLELEGLENRVAPPDKNRNSNSFLDDEILNMLKNKKELNRVLKNITHYNAAVHILRVAKNNNITDPGIITPILEKRTRLFAFYNINRMHNRELDLACELNRIPFEGRTRKELVDDLLKIELKNLEGFSV